MSVNIFDVDRNLWAALFVVKMGLKMNNDSTGEDNLQRAINIHNILQTHFWKAKKEAFI